MMQRCDGCQRRWSKKVRAGPMLRDATWSKLAAELETLCGDCVLLRAAQRKITLTFADLEPCAFNCFGSPSWFDRFGGERGDSQQLKRVRTAIERT